jgi:DNA-binding transcriptional ArsR family regulator
MKANYPSLMPILRSDVQGRILAILLVNKDSEFSVSDLASRVQTSLPTALREIRRLEAVGFVKVRPAGNMQLVIANQEHPLFAALTEIVLYSFGPVEVMRELIVGLEGLDEAWIYGSWAERYQGVTGVDPGDIDVLLVGEFDRSAAFDIGLKATSLIGKEVSVNNLSAEDWNRQESGFVKTVRSRPMVSLKGD